MRPTIYTARHLEDPITLSFEEGLRLLRLGAVDTEHGVMRFGSNYTFLVTVRLDDIEALAVYKPRLGEAPLWDFPTGTLCKRELAAFYLSEALGWDLVPPTALREDAPRGIGSLQIFIHHDPNCHYFRFEPRHLPQIKRFLAFDVVANNADRKGGHVLLDAADHIWGIDHGLCFNHVPKLRTVMWEFGSDEMPLAGTPIPDDVLADLRCLLAKLQTPDDAVLQLIHLLAEEEVTALRRRLATLINHGTFPMPRPGGSRPWPPV
jgi:uncharacterized repeat protein (TIGR03843 family)